MTREKRSRSQSRAPPALVVTDRRRPAGTVLGPEQDHRPTGGGAFDRLPERGSRREPPPSWTPARIEPARRRAHVGRVSPRGGRHESGSKAGGQFCRRSVASVTYPRDVVTRLSGRDMQPVWSARSCSPRPGRLRLCGGAGGPAVFHPSRGQPSLPVCSSNGGVYLLRDPTRAGGDVW